MAQSQKQPEANCPTCGGPLARTPAGQSVLHKVSQAMAQKGRPSGPPRVPQGPSQALPGSVDPRAVLIRRLMQGRGR